VSVKKILLCQFHCKPRQSRVRPESPGLESIPKVSANRGKVAENNDARKAVSATFFSFKMMWGYISAKKLDTERGLLLPVSISLKIKDIRS